MCGDTSFTTGADCPTAYTDGWDVKINPEFFMGLPDKQRAFLVAHESFHKALRQLTVWKALFKQDGQRANRAADYVINQMIVDMDPKREVVEFIDGCLLDPKYQGMDTKQVFYLLASQENEGGEGEGGALDSHEWGADDAVSEAEKEARERAIDNALRQGSMLAGKMGGDVPRGIGEILEPKVNWREQLRDFVTSATAGRDASTWRKPNRRWLAQGMYMPSTYSETMGKIVVAIDTSGSIGRSELAEFLSELVAICDTVKPESVELLWWGTRVAGHQTFQEGEYGNLPSQVKPKGGGGTDFACVPAYVEQERLNPECVVVLTDGYVSGWGAAPACPILFGITSSVVAPYGVTVAVGGRHA
jgi:predicted metal-dependent peptidase